MASFIPLEFLTTEDAPTWELGANSHSTVKSHVKFQPIQMIRRFTVYTPGMIRQRYEHEHGAETIKQSKREQKLKRGNNQTQW